jgi:hypothetical protein|tara:strand:- start:863 stop:1018 length:156 start_codon:yes stop_codon:yes gene_type:complete
MNDVDFMEYVRTRETDCPVCKEPLKDHNEAKLQACGFMIGVFNKANGKENA